MNSILKYGSIAAIPSYNCSAHTPEEWTVKDGVRRPIAGTIDMAYGTVMNILYIPLISVMFKKEFFKFSCFKIMIFLAIVDMFALWVSSMITGFLAFRGAVYCTYPSLIYMAGLMGLDLWCCSCVTAMSLVINRLIDLTNPDLSKLVFKGNRTYLVISFPVVYGLSFMLFTTPPVFSSKYNGWFFDPMIFENRSQEYANILHSINNILVVSVTCILYVSYCFVVGNKIRGTQTSPQILSKSRKMSIQIFIQSALICAINQFTSMVFVIMNFIKVPYWLIIIWHNTWQLGHGAPALIYISLNATIRDALLRMLKLKKPSPDNPLALFIKTNRTP